ncbi:MAG: DUF3592 domain-containing protein [Acidobacteriaceae bacterium]|nr:DUF3592 domain-containing protein [Acidobacteriaceae bacterium]
MFAYHDSFKGARSHYLEIVLGVGVTSLSLWNYYLLFHYLIYKHKSKKWPLVRATVHDVGYNLDDESGTYFTIATYSFAANGDWTGHYSRDFGSEEHAKAFARFALGRNIPIRYKPSNPRIFFADESGLAFTPMNSVSTGPSANPPAL